MAMLKDTQQKIFEFIDSKKGDLSDLSLRDIGEEAGVGKRPQIVAHHIAQLEKKGYLRKLSSKPLKYIVLKVPIENVVMIKRYQFAECGPDGLFGDDNVVGEVPLPSLPFGITSPESYFLIDARGDSMKPMIENGDLVLAYITQDIQEKDIAVIVHNEVPKIKRISFKETSKGNFCALESVNSGEYQTEFVDPEVENFRFVGKVKNVIKSYH